MRLAGWGSFDASELSLQADRYRVSPGQVVEQASTLEDLVRGVSAGLPPLRANRFGVDYVRAFLAARVLEYAGLQGDMRRRADADAKGESLRVPPEYLRAALYKLIEWLHTPEPGASAPPAPTQ